LAWKNPSKRAGKVEGENKWMTLIQNAKHAQRQDSD